MALECPPGPKGERCVWRNPHHAGSHRFWAGLVLGWVTWTDPPPVVENDYRGYCVRCSHNICTVCGDWCDMLVDSDGDLCCDGECLVAEGPQPTSQPYKTVRTQRV